MYSSRKARDAVQKRGPRFAVIGTIRPGEAHTEYRDTLEQAEKLADDFRDQWDYYQVAIHPPVEYDEPIGELRTLGKTRRALQAEMEDVTSRARALAIRLCDEGAVSEVRAADLVGVDRMTVRTWRGKTSKGSDLLQQVRKAINAAKVGLHIKASEAGDLVTVRLSISHVASQDLDWDDSPEEAQREYDHRVWKAAYNVACNLDAALKDAGLVLIDHGDHARAGESPAETLARVHIMNIQRAA